MQRDVDLITSAFMNAYFLNRVFMHLFSTILADTYHTLVFKKVFFDNVCNGRFIHDEGCCYLPKFGSFLSLCVKY